MNNSLEIKNELNQLMEVELLPVESNYSLDKYETFSLEKLKTLGLNYTNIAQVLKESKGVKETGETLYRLVEPKGTKGALHFKKGITIGNYMNDGKISARAGFKAVTQTGTKVAQMNPYAMMITLAVSMVTKKLDAIKDVQLEIMEFLKLQEESKIKGNIKTLQEISNEYKFNMNNDTYKNNKHILVQDIKRDSEQSIILAKEVIVSKASKAKLLHFDKAVKKKKELVEKAFENYHLALYQFSYSSFLEVMLLENFDENYLNSVYEKITKYIDEFKKLRNDCYEKMLKYSNTSVETTAVKGFSKVTKFLGEKAKKVKWLDEEDIDDELLEISLKADNFNENKISKALSDFIEDQEKCSLVFVENLMILNNLFNKEIDIVVDENNIYIQIEEELKPEFNKIKNI